VWPALVYLGIESQRFWCEKSHPTRSLNFHPPVKTGGIKIRKTKAKLRLGGGEFKNIVSELRWRG